VTLFAGTGSQTGTSRWGDYSAMTIDPVDDCTFWYTQEYYATTSSFNWRTRIGAFKFPGCNGTVTRTLTVASANPGSGVSISVSPTDNSGLGNGTTQFTRTYNNNTNVTLTAPATAGGNNFQKWQRNGVDWSVTQAANVTLDADYTMTAVYVPGVTPGLVGYWKFDENTVEVVGLVKLDARHLLPALLRLLEGAYFHEIRQESQRRAAFHASMILKKDRHSAFVALE
jgi:hypothetical protein